MKKFKIGRYYFFRAICESLWVGPTKRLIAKDFRDAADMGVVVFI